METFTALMLVCSIATAPAACQPENAISTVRGPKFANQALCSSVGQTTVAPTEIAPRAGEEYLKIKCVRTKG
jgi:hypothetical protein